MTDSFSSGRELAGVDLGKGEGEKKGETSNLERGKGATLKSRLISDRHRGGTFGENSFLCTSTRVGVHLPARFAGQKEEVIQGGKILSIRVEGVERVVEVTFKNAKMTSLGKGGVR